MSLSGEELETLRNFISYSYNNIKKKIPPHPTYKILLSQSQKGAIQCKMILEENVSPETINKLNLQLTNQKPTMYNEYTHLNNWEKLSFALESDKEKIQLNANVKDLEGKTVKFKYSYTSFDLIFHFEQNQFNEANMSSLIKTFGDQLFNSKEIKEKTTITIIIDYKNIFDRIKEVDELLANESLLQFKDKLKVYLNEIISTEIDSIIFEASNNNQESSRKTEFSIYVINKKECIHQKFNNDSELPSKIAQTILNGDQEPLFLKKIKQANKSIKAINYLTSFTFDVSSYALYSLKTQSIEIKSICALSLKGKLRTKEYNLMMDLAKFNANNTNKLEELKTFNVIPVDKCKNCSKTIQADEYQYQCYWCNIAFCIQCVETQIEKNTGRNCYIHKQHNLIYFKTKNKEDLKELDEYKLGKNLFVTVADTSLRYSHQASCNGCYTGFHNETNNQRYICISCLPGEYRSGGFVDFCYGCIVKIREKKVASLCDSHNDDKHVQLMIIHQVSTYAEY